MSGPVAARILPSGHNNSMSSMFIDDLRRSHRGLAEPGYCRTFEVSYGKIVLSVDVNVGR